MSNLVTVGLWSVDPHRHFGLVQLGHREMPEWEGRELTPDEAEMLGRVLIQAAAMARRGQK